MFKKTHYQDIYLYDSQKSGPTVVIMGGTHGDEICGVQVFNWFLKDFFPKNQIKKGKIYLILANYMAVGIQKRFYNEDLNRLYGFKKTDNINTFEKRRVLEIMEILKQADWLLDIHSTSLPSAPMACCYDSEQNLDFCKKLKIPYIITGWSGKTVGLASDEYIKPEQGVAITLECGSYKNPLAFSVGKKTTLFLLSYTDLLDSKHDSLSKKNQTRHINVFDTIYSKSKNFQFLMKNPKSFLKISKGEIYAIDGVFQYKANQDCLLIMPNKNIKEKAEEVGFLGKLIS